MRGISFSNTYNIKTRNRTNRKWSNNFALNPTQVAPQNVSIAQQRKPSPLEELIGQFMEVDAY